MRFHFVLPLAAALASAPAMSDAYWFSSLKSQQQSGQVVRGDRNTSVSGSYQSGVSKVDSQEDKARREAAAKRREEAMKGNPDVFLDIPNVSVDKIDLEVENLKANVALDARVANLVKLTAGADVSIDRVKLTIEGVRAEALLVVRLDNVREILDRTLTTVDRNPELMNRLLQSVDNAVDTVGDLGVQALNTLGPTLDNLTKPGGVLSETVNTLGQTVRTTISETGDIVQSTTDAAGAALGTKTLGNLLQLDVIEQISGANGSTIKRVKDSAGNVIDFAVDQSGKILGYRMAPKVQK